MRKGISRRWSSRYRRVACDRCSSVWKRARDSRCSIRMAKRARRGRVSVMTHISLCLLWMAAPAVAQEQELLAVRRVFVEQLNGGDAAYQIRDLIISALQNSKLFVITENKDRADAVIRGS